MYMLITLVMYTQQSLLLVSSIFDCIFNFFSPFYLTLLSSPLHSHPFLSLSLSLSHYQVIRFLHTLLIRLMTMFPTEPG